jgi:cobalt-zinc-cadmium resistance protein CzcA
MPNGYRTVWAGEFGQLQQAKARLAVIVPITIVLIVGLLYTLFNRLLECLLTLAGIPFAVAGGVLALWVSGLNFSISAGIGFISLFGVSVMNGILLMTYYKQALLRGGTPMESMFHAGSTRMRPLLMTSLSACIGLFPAAISKGIGSEVQRPLATVIVGGMLIGPIMLLIVVPALKVVFLDKQKHAVAVNNLTT